MTVRPHLSDNSLRATTAGLTTNIQITLVPGLSVRSTSSIWEFHQLWEFVELEVTTAGPQGRVSSAFGIYSPITNRFLSDYKCKMLSNRRNCCRMPENRANLMSQWAPARRQKYHRVYVYEGHWQSIIVTRFLCIHVIIWISIFVFFYLPTG